MSIANGSIGELKKQMYPWLDANASQMEKFVEAIRLAVNKLSICPSFMRCLANRIWSIQRQPIQMRFGRVVRYICNDNRAPQGCKHLQDRISSF